MALPATLYRPPQPSTPTVYGKAINVVPGDPSVQVEVQRASDSGGTGATTIASGLLFPKPGAPFVDQRANDGASWFYRARHNSAGGDAGAWTAWVGGVVKAIPPAILAAAVNGPSVYPIVRAAPMDDALYALRATASDGSTAKSDAYNPQGSVLPVPWAANLFSYSAGGLGATQMWVGFTWSAQTLTKPDGSTLSVPVPPAALAAPTLSQVAGGTRAALTLFARIALVKDGQYMALSAESSFAVSANNLLKITSPGSVAGYDGWIAWVGSATNAEWLQDQTGTRPIPFGTDYTEPAAHFQTGVTQYSSTLLGKLFYANLQPSTTYYFYAFFDLALGFIRFSPFISPVGSGAGDTAPSMADAALAWKDGRIGLTPSNFTALTPAGAGTSSGTVGGSRLT